MRIIFIESVEYAEGAAFLRGWVEAGGDLHKGALVLAHDSMKRGRREASAYWYEAASEIG